MTEQLRCADLIKTSIGLMSAAPTPLAPAIVNVAKLREEEFPDSLTWLMEHLKTTDINSTVLHAIGLAIRKWDRAESGKWLGETKAFSGERRNLVYQRLELPSALCTVLQQCVPIFQDSDRPVVIAEKHRDWFASRVLRNSFYWDAYASYLQKTKNWTPESVAKLDHGTDEVVRRLTDPCQEEVYSSRGLVVGYVQSGKTANFSGVLAKAADAGYRFIIVLAGTLDILRSQTQRRLDKELIGKEQVGTDYVGDSDWDEFLSFGAMPSDLGAFNWERLTGPAEDYRELKQAISALEFKALIPGRPYNAPENLQVSPVRILVIKKIPKVMERLAKDLERIKKRLAHVPTLIVDDESDQASINTIDPSKGASADEKIRTSTNKLIVHLLNTINRAQYVGYTATPFANVFVDPNDAEDLFPKDFIVSLPRPSGYMGVMDFYDMDSKPEGFQSNEKAFIRDVRGEDCGGDMVNGAPNPNHLQNAIDSFVLAGALKLFREAKADKKLKYKHHTMLVHHSVTKADHAILAEKVQNTFEQAGYHAGDGINRLKTLLQEDFLPVSVARESQLPRPKKFAELAPFIGPCIARLSQQKTVLIVNGDNKDDTPDFDKNGVWAILVGGTKLSRGYTVEGLTTTYFRRVSNTTDTLMQMGRWFGYRPGYGDLVRLFIGRNEPFGNKGKNRLDLYMAFEAICRDEEKFRQEIKKYQDGTLTPKQIPPLVPSHLTSLRPTAKNKMYNAEITFKNFGGDSSEPTVAPIALADAVENQKRAATLLENVNLIECNFNGKRAGGGTTNGSIKVSAYCGLTSNANILKFLECYRWAEGRPILYHQCQFIKDEEKIHPVTDWLIIAPRVEKSAHGKWPEEPLKNGFQVAVQERKRVGARFGVYSTSAHRAVAEYISQISEHFEPSSDKNQYLRSSKRGVMLLYPVRDPDDSFTSIGFALIFPKNSSPKKIAYSVRDKSKPGEVVVHVTDNTLAS